MKHIPTAEEIFKQAFNTSHCHIDYDKAGLITIKQAMIEFAKLHVEAALKEAEYCTEEYDFSVEIKNCYPLENIK